MAASFLLQRDRPLYDDVIYSRPEQRRIAGRLLLAGGHSGSFHPLAQIYDEARTAGIGKIVLVMPDSLKKIVGNLLSDAIFAPSGPGGAFAKDAAERVLALATDTEGLILADFSQNAEAGIVMREILAGYSGIKCITPEIISSFKTELAEIKELRKSFWLCDLRTARLAIAALEVAAVLPLDASRLAVAGAAKLLANGIGHPCVIAGINQVFVSDGDTVTVTELIKAIGINQLTAWLTVWLLQQPQTPLKTLTTAVFASQYPDKVL